MTTRTALFALLAAWGVGTCANLPAVAEDAVSDDPSENADSATRRELTNRVWVRADESGLPGVMRIFLSDGTLVQDSCWETHRLSEWKMTADNAVSWNEDGMDISAEILAVGADSLTLALKLGSETVEEHYTPAEVPYVCPDMPK
jgi:hypothetical protein